MESPRLRASKGFAWYDYLLEHSDAASAASRKMAFDGVSQIKMNYEDQEDDGPEVQRSARKYRALSVLCAE